MTINMTGALDGIRVLDLSRVLAGPGCTQILGDLGADILKVERPGEGDDTRKWGPPYLKDEGGNDTAESAYYLSCNRNKRSIAIDFTKPEGQALIHALMEKCDILVENYKPGGLAKYGLAYEQVKDRHPHLIYASISGYGQTGPLASEPGYDFVAQAMGGLMAVTGAPDGEPMKAGVAVSDIITGLNAGIGILAALHHREKTGRGQHIDMALLDCTIAAMTNIAQYYLTSRALPPRLGNAHSTIVPYQCFGASDGHLVIAVGNDHQFKIFCAHIGKAEWAADPRFATNSARVRNRAALTPQIADIIATKTVDEWVEGFRSVDIPAGGVNSMDRTFALEQVQARGMEIKMDHPQAPEPVSLVGSPLKLSETPATYRRPPPVLAQHTEEILREVLGMADSDIDRLKTAKVL